MEEAFCLFVCFFRRDIFYLHKSDQTRTTLSSGFELCYHGYFLSPRKIGPFILNFPKDIFKPLFKSLLLRL